MKKYLLLFLVTFIIFVKPAAAENILNVQKIISDKNIEIWYVEDKSVPVISMTFSFDGGLDLEPSDKLGVGKLVSILLDEGADDIKSEEFQKLLNDNSIDVSFSAGRDAFVGSLKTLSFNKDLAFSILKKALTSPRFDEDAIERMKQANIASIKSDMGNPSWLAARTFNGMLFEGHKYADPGAGNIPSINSITRDDLVDFAKKQFNKASLKVAIVGDISAKEASTIVDNTFGDLPDTAPEINISDAELKYAGKTILLELNTPQSYISVGSKAINRKNPLWYAANVMNYILGGSGFDARLMSEIREKRGLTYGVYSSINTMKHADIIRADLSTSNNKVAEALSVLKQEWQKMAEFGVSEEELKGAKSYITGSMLLNLTSTSAISSILNDYMQEGVDYNYINDINDNIQNVTIEEVKAAAETLLKKDELTTIIVGKPQNINADITLTKPPRMGE